MTLQIKLDLSAEDVRKMEEAFRPLKPSKADSLRKLLSVWQYMDMAKSEKLPICVSFDRLHILNDAAIEEVEITARLSERLREEREKELQEEKEKQINPTKQKAGEFYEALQLKPNIFGFGVDLKQVFKMFQNNEKEK